MGWNHRILAHEQTGEVYLQIHEIYYDDHGEPLGYSEQPISVGSEDITGIEWVLDQMKKCLGKPTLWAGDRFPEEYIPVD